MIVTNLLTLHNQLKINHWQTKSYAEHQALGGAYDEFSDLVDEFVEVFNGQIWSNWKVETDLRLSDPITKRPATNGSL
jgi:hypothetical protein